MSAQNAKSRLAAPLNTPTDLKSNATRDVAAALNLLLADTFALYVKTKNFHWHMSGPHFRDYHLLLDQADQIHINHILSSDSSRARGPRRPARAAQATIDRTPSNEMEDGCGRRAGGAGQQSATGSSATIAKFCSTDSQAIILDCCVHSPLLQLGQERSIFEVRALSAFAGSGHFAASHQVKRRPQSDIALGFEIAKKDAN